MIIRYILILFFSTLISCSSNRGALNKEIEKLINKEVDTFIGFIDKIADDESMTKGNIYSITKYKIKNDIFYLFENELFYNIDYTKIYDEKFYLEGDFPKVKLKGCKEIDENLICIYGIDNFSSINKQKEISSQFKYLKSNEPTKEEYQTYSIKYKLINNNLEINDMHMSSKDSINFTRYRLKNL